MLRTIFLHSVFVTLSVFAARLGVQEAAAIGLVLVLLATAAYALDGFAYASEIEAGQSLGKSSFGASQKACGLGQSFPSPRQRSSFSL